MKLTKSRLKQLIKEELEALNSYRVTSHYVDENGDKQLVPRPLRYKLKRGWILASKCYEGSAAKQDAQDGLDYRKEHWPAFYTDTDAKGRIINVVACHSGCPDNTYELVHKLVLGCPS